MSVVLIEMALLVLLSVAAHRWGADSRDGRDWHPVDKGRARQAGSALGAPADR